MNVRRLHRLLGLVLLLPLVGWAVTGLVFFIKPGYKDAYAPLHIRELPLDRAALPPAQEGWLEARALRTVLGPHLLVRTGSGWSHLDPDTLRARALPDEAGIRALLRDALASDPGRYGEITSVVRHDDSTAAATTTTGVAIDLDWTTLGLSQSGPDTRRIDALYRIHYLQWTGIGAVDRVLGVAGLGSLVALALLGLRLAIPRRPRA
jgi:hypothetical protein